MCIKTFGRHPHPKIADQEKEYGSSKRIAKNGQWRNFLFIEKPVEQKNDNEWHEDPEYSGTKPKKFTLSVHHIINDQI